MVHNLINDSITNELNGEAAIELSSYRANHGQSLAELMIAIGIAVLILSSAAGAIILTLRINERSVTGRTASGLAQGLLDNTRQVAEGQWESLYGVSEKGAASTYNVIGTSTLAIATGTEDISKDSVTYTRWFSVENVYRDADGSITESGGTEDASTQKITVTVQWPSRGEISEVKVVEYLTRWPRNEVIRFTDWSGGSGSEGPITSPDTKFSTSTGIDSISTVGEIKLQ